jgi:hypothetical protein
MYSEYKERLSQSVANAIGDLLAQKHLYQCVRVDMSEIERATAIPPGMGMNPEEGLEFHLREKLQFMPWIPSGDGMAIRIMRNPSFAETNLLFAVPHIKIFCPICERDEPHNPHDDILQSSLRSTTLVHGDAGAKTVQILLLDYLCQSCKRCIVTFMLCRDGNKLTIVGRNPIESVHVPSFMPKDQREYYSSALIAYNAGQTLPGLFMLRTFIEQYIYSKHPDMSEYIDKAIDAYMKSLPEEFNNRFPSLRSAYERLSVAIHSANADTTLFETISKELLIHFDAKRLYKM